MPFGFLRYKEPVSFPDLEIVSGFWILASVHAKVVFIRFMIHERIRNKLVERPG